MTICTIGHSTQPLDSFVGALRAHAIELIADVRRFPASRRHPHFMGPALAESLQSAGIQYAHLPELGGRRAPRPDSHNTAWRLDAFRGYADYMETPAFTAGVERLLRLAEQRPAAMMCAERVWWSCHRALIADYLKAHGHEVVHILSGTHVEAHPYTSAARLVDGRLSYRALI
jgi:uncharacterized protein (DUF488 family)